MNHLRVVLIGFLFLSVGLISQTPEIATSPREIYQIISREDLNTLKVLDKEAPEAIEEKISKANRFLEAYHSQYPDDRRTEAERRRAGPLLDPKTGDISKTYKEYSSKYPSRWNVNSVRLLKGNSSILPASTALIQDSNLFYLLYSHLGFLYSQKGETDKAISSFLSSIAYHDFSQTEEIIFLELESKEYVPQDRLEKIKLHKSIIEEKEKKAKEIDTKIDEFHLTAAVAARDGKQLPDEKTFRSSLDLEKKNLLDLEEKYKKSLASTFLEVQKEKGLYDSKVLKELAFLVREKERSERIATRIKEPYPLVNPDKESGFIGFFQILELAVRVNPYDSELHKVLGDEFKASGKTQKAIDSYLRYIELETADKKWEGEVSLALAGLYSSGRNYIRAIDFYDRYLSLSSDTSKTDTLFITGDLIIKRLGDYEKASTYFEKWTELTKTLTFGPGDSLREMIHLKKRMTVEHYLAKYYKIKSNREWEDDTLQKAYQTYLKAKEIENKASEELDAQKNVKDALKRKALTSPDPLLVEAFKKESDTYESLKGKLQTLQMEVKSLPTIDLLFQMAEREEDKRDYSKSVSHYREIREVGTPFDQELALKNIRRIEQIKIDGIYRERTKR
jgi:tetratricopeptide (TPR) repeat protein